MTIIKLPKIYLSILDQVRAIALEGLKYAKDVYDIERYKKLLTIITKEYSELLQKDMRCLVEQFQKEIGIITPRIGVDAAVINTNNEILILKRSDDYLWCLPGGWVEVGENIAEAGAREVKEEADLEVEPLYYIAISHKGPQIASNLQHQINIILFMKPVLAGTIINLSDEHLDYQWVKSGHHIAWHPGHKRQFQCILDFINSDKNNYIKIMDV